MGNTSRWERAELLASRERGVWDTWGVQDAEHCDDWFHFAFQQRRIYAPLEHPEISHHFARVANSESALMKFVESYGRLGWYELLASSDSGSLKTQWFKDMTEAHRHGFHVEGDKRFYAEPIDWIQAHARTVGWCLLAGHALKLERPRDRERECLRLGSALPKPTGLRERPENNSLLREETRGNVSPQDFVGGMLEDYLWINLRGVRRRVMYTKGSLRSLWGGSSLIESIYTQVTDVVTKGRLAQCADCGAVFIQTDERQRFCPPREGQTKSACMNRQRVRRYRDKARRMD